MPLCNAGGTTDDDVSQRSFLVYESYCSRGEECTFERAAAIFFGVILKRSRNAPSLGKLRSLRTPWLALSLLAHLACGSSHVDDPAASSPDGGLGVLGDGSLGINLCGKAGCVCQPFSATCSDGKARACKVDGSGYVDFVCDPLQGMTCATDGCKGACAPPELGQSYIGCDYYPTVTLNPVWSGFDFAVAVGNASTSPGPCATVTRGSASVATATVDTAGIQIVKLPWVAELKGGDLDACQEPPGTGEQPPHRGGGLPTSQRCAGHRLSIQPAHLRDPLTAPPMCPVGTSCPGGKEPSCKSFSNDASLLTGQRDDRELRRSFVAIAPK